jgi:opacity protein-like surface antigen
MHYSSQNGDLSHNQEFPENKFIKDDFTWGHTLRLGAEIKITPQFAVRAGYMEQTSPMRKNLANNNVEVLPSGTLPHFTVTSKPASYYTVGFGYRFTPNTYMDLACVYRYNSACAYAFSNIYNDKKEVVVESVPASLKTKTTHLMLTLGYKF